MATMDFPSGKIGKFARARQGSVNVDKPRTGPSGAARALYYDIADLHPLRARSRPYGRPGEAITEITRNSNGSDFQPLAPHRFVPAQIGRAALEHHPAMAHDVEAVGNLHRDGELLFDQQDRNLALRDALQQHGDALDHLRRK